MKSLNPYKLYISLLIFVVLILVITKLAYRKESRKQRDYREIISEGVLRIAIVDNAETLFDVDSKNSGFAYEFFRKFRPSGDIEIELHSYENKLQALKNLYNGDVDIAACHLPIISDYRRFFNFTDPIDKDRLVLVQRIGAATDTLTLKSTLDLANKTVHIPHYMSYKLRLQNISQEIASEIFIEEHDNLRPEHLIKMVSDTTIDYTICDESTAQLLTGDYENIDISLPVGFTQLKGWAVRKDSPELLDSLNNWLHNSKIFLY